MRKILRVAAGILLWAVLLVLIEWPTITPGQYLALAGGLAVAVWLGFRAVPFRAKDHTSSVGG